jgi:hypothetical protein
MKFMESFDFMKIEKIFSDPIFYTHETQPTLLHRKNTERDIEQS